MESGGKGAEVVDIFFKVAHFSFWIFYMVIVQNGTKVLKRKSDGYGSKKFESPKQYELYEICIYYWVQGENS